MGKMKARVTVNCAAIVARVTRAVDEQILQTAHNIVQDAAREAPIDTSALSQSLYVVTSQVDEYNDAAEAASSSNPTAQIFPPVVVNELHMAVIPSVVHYAEYVHDGIGSNIAIGPRPFLLNATTQNERDFERGLDRRIWEATQ